MFGMKEIQNFEKMFDSTVVSGSCSGLYQLFTCLCHIVIIISFFGATGPSDSCVDCGVQSEVLTNNWRKNKSEKETRKMFPVHY